MDINNSVTAQIKPLYAPAEELQASDSQVSLQGHLQSQSVSPHHSAYKPPSGYNFRICARCSDTIPANGGGRR